MVDTIETMRLERGEIMTTVMRRDGESFDNMLKRFRKGVTRDKVLSTLRRNRFHVTKGELERMKKRKGIQRARRRARRKASRMDRRTRQN